MLIDAHTHLNISGPLNIYVERMLVGVDTFGIHPWQLLVPFSRVEFIKKWNLLVANLDQSKILAIGECGLDRRKIDIAAIDDQLWVLDLHFQLASNLNLPLVLHLVKTFSDWSLFIKQNKFQNNILIHDFSGNKNDINSLVKYHCYFGIGPRLFKNPKRLLDIPLDRLLFETDDQLIYSILDIYNKAADILNMPIAELENIIEKNYREFLTSKKH